MARWFALVLALVCGGCANDVLINVQATPGYYRSNNGELVTFEHGIMQIAVHQIGGLGLTNSPPCGFRDNRTVKYDVVMRGPWIGSRATGDLVATFNKESDIVAVSTFTATWEPDAWLVQVRGSFTDGCRSGVMGGDYVFYRQ
jgi:hypothetical protein